MIAGKYDILIFNMVFVKQTKNSEFSMCCVLER